MRIGALTLTLTVCAASACGPDSRDVPTPAEPFDLLIADGTVVDGSGDPGRNASILIRGDRIAFVGDLDPDTIQVDEVFDASGLVVAPGFIDAHAHGDPIGDPTFENFLAMGVTTIMLGQDGGSPKAVELVAHLDSVQLAGPGVNVGYLVGHNTVREESGVGFGTPDSEGLVRMAELVDEGLSAGAFGLSTGLEYDPGSRADADELAAIAEPVAAVGGVVVSHMRSEDADKVDDALLELLEQGRRTGARVHATHLKIVLSEDETQVDSLLRIMESARADGVAVTADVYPYTASYTGIGILFPEWARPPAEYETVRNDRRDELANHLRRRVESRNGPEATLFGSGEYSGRTLAEVAAELERPFEDVLIELGPGGASAAYFVMDDDVMGALLEDPHSVVSSDGSPTMQHPRGYGSFPRVIRSFVVEEGRLSIEEAVRKMSAATAAIYRLDDADVLDRPRGRIQEGWAADLVAFDPAEMRDEADFGAPHRLATGMRAVWVNGRFAWRDGAPTGEDRSGRALRADW